MQSLYDDINTNQLKPIYLFYGEETWLMNKGIQDLTNSSEPQTGTWGIETLDGSTTEPQTVAMSALEGNLFGGCRIIVVKDINWFETLTKTTSKSSPKKPANAAAADPTSALITYLDHPNPQCLLILTARQNIDKRRKLIQAIQKKGRLIECNTPKGMQKDNWLMQHFTEAGFKAERRAVANISINCANLSQMAQEAAKLMLYKADTKEITYADTLALISESSLMTVFELTDATLAKDAPKACAVYQRLLRQGEAEQKIFALLSTQFRNILLTQDLLSQQKKSAQISQELSLHPFVTEKYTTAGKLFSRRQLMKALEILLSADIAQKTGKGEMKDLLETAIIRICAMR